QDVPDPTGLLQRRSLDGGRTWGPFESLRDADREGRHWFCDPSYIHDRLTGAVHVFYSHAKDRGVWDAVAGTDDTDRDVLGSVVGTSDDQGRSWTHRSVTAIAAPPELVRTAFPTSGAGIQLRRGEHAGRLPGVCGRTAAGSGPTAGLASSRWCAPTSCSPMTMAGRGSGAIRSAGTWTRPPSRSSPTVGCC